jgi:hypothetical protein
LYTIADGNGYSYSHSYTYSQANAHCQAQHNTEDTAHPAAAPVASVDEQETH